MHTTSTWHRPFPGAARMRHPLISFLLGINLVLLSLPALASDGDLAPGGGRDGQVIIADVMIALRYALGLIPEVPAEGLHHGDIAPLVNGIPAPDGSIGMSGSVRLKVNGANNPPIDKNVFLHFLDAGRNS